ncbi:hypothetical protein HNR16_001301 [Pseudoclavibacter chungangensis]|uniref:hypothetical protein n=1 Tax=Pseudoclavibacter chungangensis TaxID=587635 RepID=UPI00185D3366|nr:hypothetical protein [Pseudoclavibacter chungangensis]NYJ66513.1 hypothetical protein [Pseudoclavibacter chungangensis]
MREATRSFNVEAVRILLAEGASVDAIEATSSPLFLALRITENKDITETARIAELLLANGARVTPETREQVQRIGKRFEHYRDIFTKDSLDESDAALNELYRLFDVEPVPQRVRHDGVSPILVPDGEWFEQHEALWEFLVPGMEAAGTTQGEVIRLTGKLAREILDYGSINWNRNFRKMLKAVPTYFDLGDSLPASELREAASIARRGWRGRLSREQVYRLEQLAVEWVERNPDPIALPRPAYMY